MQAFTVGLDAFLVIFGALLYLAEYSNPTIVKVQRQLRKPLHLLAHLGTSLVFVVSTQTSESVVCSYIWPEYCAVEFLIFHLIMPSIYPILAAIPLTLALPLQVITCCIYFVHNATMCRTGIAVCKKAPKQYRMLRGIIAKLTFAIPFGAPDSLTSNLPAEADCPTVLSLIEIFLLLIAGLYATFAVEASSRFAYCATRRRTERLVATRHELAARKSKPWKFIGEALVALLLASNVVSLFVNVWFLNQPGGIK